ncbi:MAG: c-type cytochrome [Pseudohongiellaceae bacterium]
MKTFLTLTVSIAALVCASAVLAADAGVTAQTDDRYCMTCHGVDGVGNIGIQAPRLAGMEPWYLKRQLENFRAGIRGTHVEDDQGLAMQPMAARLTDESIADIVSWVQSWEYLPAEITIEGNSARGRTAFQSCAACHGTAAEGNEALGAPALAGQNDWYLITQLKNFRAGYRGIHQDDSYGAQMLLMVRMLSDDQAIIDVVSYINTLGR